MVDTAMIKGLASLHPATGAIEAWRRSSHPGEDVLFSSNPPVSGSESGSGHLTEQALIRVFWPIRCL